ncbi:S8 family serine peptidase [Herbiconiux sp. CPCC 205763]|uniref:S8 family serine peptidase n=1 Tax=Herbiconiux aconitum TaxID=2970913 RepID=A0ABT2GPK6_9MICO|nr:S8 family peptidase [Herbiconiux aconitum]MCS5717225.1 S8 family serine peptidase [Herbiconiux aconitum]
MNTSPAPIRASRPSRPSRRSGLRFWAAATATILATGIGAGAMVAGPAAAAGTAAPSSASTAATAAPTDPTDTTDPAAFADGRYIVTLKSDAVAAYRGGLAKFPGTQPAPGDDLDTGSRRVADYSSYLASVQEQVADSVDADITTSYTLTTNGFSSTLTAGQAKTLAADPRVARVVPDELLHLTATPSTDYLGLSGADGVWAQTGGVESAGDGIVVGIIDSGIAPENASFAGEALATTPGADPYLDGDAVVFDKADGSTFHGACETGEQFTADDCSTKLITARYFVDSYGPDTIGRDRGEYLSPRDGSGHGSHTSSTAAGDADVAAEVAGRDLGLISGVVPGAKVAMYKACWTGPTPYDDGCQTGDLLAAIDAAVEDGVDVINYSIGGGAAQTTISLTDEAFLNAASVGVFVAASAGNDGPEASTADNAAPWITTVAASTIPSYEATVRLGDGQVVLGGSITVPTGAPVSGAFVDATAAAAAGVVDPQLCGPDTLDPAKVKGAIVLCDRGVVDRVAKSAEVKRAGGIGLVLVNTHPDSVDLDTHTVPTVHVDSAGAELLHAYAATTGATVTLEDGNPDALPSPPTPQVAGFSSRGPILADGGDILKPDIAAPGVGILAAFANSEGQDGQYALLSGTSMASPHIAGLAALYLGEHPDATPAEIKSAMMTTAYDTVDGSGAPITDPFAQGAGQVDPTRYFDPGMLFLNDVDDWYGYAEAITGLELGVDTVSPSELNLASISVGALAGTETITRTATSTRAGSFTASPVEVPGIDVVVSPSTLDFSAAGEELEYTVTFTRTDAPLDEFATGQLIWTDGDETVTTPLAVRPVTLGVPREVAAEGTDASVDIPVSVGTTGDIDVTKAGLVKGDVLHGTGTASPDGTPTARDRFVVQVPEGTTFSRFALDSLDDTADLDLYLSLYDDNEQVTPINEAATANPDETLDVPGLSPGRYIAEVDFFSGQGDLDYTLTNYFLGSETNEGAFAVTPEKLHMTLGEPAAVTASWNGLEPGASYLGRVGFGDSGRSTNITVTTPGDPVAPTGELAMTVDPQWARAGTDVAVHASGLTPAEPYTITVGGGADVVVHGLGSAAGRADKAVLLPAGLADGAYPVTLESAAGTVEGTVNVAKLLVYSTFEVTQYDSDGAATTALETSYVGTGEMRVMLTGAAGTVLDERITVSSDPIFWADTVRSSAANTPAGVYTADVWAVAEDGSLTQHFDYVFTVAASKPSDVTITQNPGDPNLADLAFTNRSGNYFEVRLRYKLCSGPVVFSTVDINKERIEKTFDMTGATYVELIRADGVVLATYQNSGPARCADEPKISQDWWVTFSEAPTVTEEGKPVSMVFSNRVATWSHGFDFSAGVGDSIREGQFYYQQTPHELVTEPSLVVTVPLSVPENEAIWTRAFYESSSPDIHLTAHRVIYALPVTLAMLQPVTDAGGPGTGEPGEPGDPGGPGAGDPGADLPGAGGSGQGSVGAGGASGDLAATGSGALSGVIASIVLLLAGATAVLVRSRRRRA